MNQPRSRVTGTEMEWGLLTRCNEKSPFAVSGTDIASAIRHLDKRIRKSPAPYNMLSNGGRLYIDVGSHPEYATPEDTSLMGTVANEIAGERIMFDTLEEAREAGDIYDFILSKRVVDDKLHTWGYHINFCGDAEGVDIDRKTLAPLGLHLATANILLGAGAVIPTKDGAVFTIGQKVLNLNRDFAGSSHSTEQPLISLRNESHAGDSYERVHVTSMDANMSPWATWIKLGTTSLVIRMIEKGYIQDMDAFKDDMHQVAVDVAYDSDMQNSYELEDGRRVRAIDVQYELMQLAKKMADSGEIPEEEYAIVGEWERALEDLDADPSRLIDRVEWVAKRETLKRYMAKHALVLSDTLVREKDRQWSYIGPLGIAQKLREGLWSQWMPPAWRIEHAYTNPPTTTRALARVCLADYLSNVLGEDAQVNWGWVKRGREHDNQLVVLGDPYDHHMPRLV